MTFVLDVVAHVSLDWSGVTSLPSSTKEDGRKSMARCPRELLVSGMAAQLTGLKREVERPANLSKDIVPKEEAQRWDRDDRE